MDSQEKHDARLLFCSGTDDPAISFRGLPAQSFGFV
jgi:hypothetical protein